MKNDATTWVEWPTLFLVLACYLVWILATTVVSTIWLPAGVILVALCIALHSSLQHEVIHGHPFANIGASEALIFPAIGLYIPYMRFKDTHMSHHQDANLTDPYDDPETNYLDPTVWETLPRALQFLLAFNNTLLGRLVVGPLVGQINFMSEDFKAIRNGDRRVLLGWALHIPAIIIPLIWLTYFTNMPIWAYLISAYLGLSILKIRTFLEHQASQHSADRTVIVEDRGFLAFLFLNNNLHVVHHMNPRVPWYNLPDLYRDNRECYQERNSGYSYTSYREIFQRYFFKAKDGVPHPLWRSPK